MEHQHNPQFCLHCVLANITPLLPHQGPIKDFIHQNTLQVFIDRPFHQAVVDAASMFAAKPYMDLGYYRAKFARGEIDYDNIALAMEEEFGSLTDNEREVVFHALLNLAEVIDEKALRYLASKQRVSFGAMQKAKERAILNACSKHAAPASLRALVNARVGCQIDHEVNAILFRLVGAYIDQGVILWPLLEECPDFVTAVLRLAKETSVPLARFVDNQDFASFLEDGCEDGVLRVLANMFAAPGLYGDYVQESLLHHPGWSGMINVVAHHPDSLAKFRAINVAELLLVKLALEWQFINCVAREFRPISMEDFDNAREEMKSVIETSHYSVAHWLINVESALNQTISDEMVKKIDLVALQRIWQIALERSYYANVVEKIADKNAVASPVGAKKFQAIFCIDDRECSFRRHLEAQSSEIETFGFPGFFGIEFFFKSHKKDLLEKMCPAPVTPKHMVMEHSYEPSEKNNDKDIFEFASFISRHGANSIFFGFISAYTLGHLSAFRLLFSFFQPSILLSSKRRAHDEEKTALVFERSDEQLQDGLLLGFTHEEMAQRIFTALRNMGLTKSFAPMVFAIAHGSSSVNNPHFAAYDCGACSGRPGGVNARLFAAMANIKEVRELVKKRGITIPDETVFVGALHDTCTDEITFFDLDKLSESAMKSVNEFSKHVAVTQSKNAKERCRRFAVVHSNISESDALKEVHHRARALFEPRPELGHATNALCIVGRRERTYQKNFDRRAFLQSYDPTTDQSGEVLAAIMSAVIPVCGGINLEYFFSRVDPAIYGCGTKLSHNVCSLIGVGNGLDDDLRTGLPIQMTEIHDPIRLLIVIEQWPDIIDKAVMTNPLLAPWVRNDWVKVASLSPLSNQLSIYDYRRQKYVPMTSAGRHS